MSRGLHVVFLASLLVSGCASKRITFNGLICPHDYNEQMLARDLSECHYYDQKDAEASATPKPSGACLKCLLERGYEVE